MERSDSEDAAYAAVQRAQTAWLSLSEQQERGPRGAADVAEVVQLLLDAIEAAIAKSRDNGGANTRIGRVDYVVHRHLLIPLEMEEV